MSYQCTVASVDEAAQKLLEPGAPPPEVRIAFMEEVAARTEVKRLSFRMNPIVPGANDSDEQIRATIERLGRVSARVKRVAFSYMYGSPKILTTVRKRTGIDLGPRFDKTRGGVKGATGKFHVLAELRFQKLKFARQVANPFGIKVSSCGCDNGDVEELAEERCGICWRSEVV